MQIDPLDLHERRAVTWIHGIQLATVLACTYSPFLALSFVDVSALSSFGGYFKVFWIAAALILAPIIIPEVLFLWWRRRNPRCAFHALQNHYWQLLFYAVIVTILGSAFFMESDTGFVIDGREIHDESVVFEILLGAVVLAHLFYLGRAFFLALVFHRESRHPIVGRFASAVTVRLPRPLT